MMSSIQSMVPAVRATLVGLAMALSSLPAEAGIGDSPLPSYPEKAKHVFSISGVVKRATLETAIRCTLVRAKEGLATVGVEFFDESGDKIGQGNFGMGVGGTNGIATGAVASDSFNYMSSLPLFSGSARVVSDAPEILCDAFVIEKSGSPPVSMRSLPVIRKLKQKGD
mgnify:CR=1 FL=1